MGVKIDFKVKYNYKQKICLTKNSYLLNVMFRARPAAVKIIFGPSAAARGPSVAGRSG